MADSSNLDISYQISRQKIILVGDVNVGKTCIIGSLLGIQFSEEYEPSIGVDFFTKNLKFKGKQIKLQIWDSAGQEKFKSLIPNYIRGSVLVFIVYDVSNKKSFENLNEWINFVYNIENTNIAIVGNKIDLGKERVITKEEAEEFAKDKNLEYYEVSAKTNTNIQDMFFQSLAGLPFFNILNNDNLSKKDIVHSLYEENENFEQKDNSLNEDNLNSKGVMNIANPNSFSKIEQTDVNNADENKEQKKQKKKCC